MSLIIFCKKRTKKYMVKKSLPEGLIIIGTPQFTCLKGSFTVEAAILLPMLACFFTFILFFFQIMQIQITVQSALEKTGRNMAFLAATETEKREESMEQRRDENELVNLSLAKTSICLELQDEECISHYVNGGAVGISLLASEVEGNYIILEANYSIEFPVKLLGKRTIWMKQWSCFRKWTGWHAVDLIHAEEMQVFVTANGESYHMRTSCPYLSLSIQKVQKELVPVLRNKDGTKYKECTICRKEESICESVYITNYGERYHYDINCRGLKRIIYEKKLSEVRDKNPCRKCWK